LAGLLGKIIVDATVAVVVVIPAKINCRLDISTTFFAKDDDVDDDDDDDGAKPRTEDAKYITKTKIIPENLIRDRRR
jgi:hypothetical protein